MGGYMPYTIGIVPHAYRENAGPAIGVILRVGGVKSRLIFSFLS